MHANVELSTWLINSLFILGILLLPLGLSFLLIPEKVLKLGDRLNHWVKTEHYFEILNKPRYQERIVYRYHHLFGILVIIFTSVSIYLMYFSADVPVVMDSLALWVDSAFAKWLIVMLYHILAGANVLAFIIGLIILIRPSMLKILENKANHWVHTDEKMKILDSTRELPAFMFPGNPRIFGILVILGAMYIIWHTMP